jgi:PAS domain S-box-containing protein
MDRGITASAPSADETPGAQLTALGARLAGLEAECRRLKLSERHFRSLVEHAADIIVVLSRKGTIQYCSPSGERMLEYTMSELAGKSMRGFVHPDDLPRTLRSIGMFLGTPGATITREFRLRRKDGRWRHFEVSATNLLDDPAVCGIVVDAHDITERVRMETFFKSSLVEKETLLKEIHHRVKNNLQLVSSMLGLQAHQIEDEAVAKIFRDSKDRIRSMALIHEQLYESKNLADISLSGYLARLVRHLIGSHGATASGVRFMQSVGGLALDIDRMIYFGLLVNEIVTNSLKHAFPGGGAGEIRIEAWEDAEARTITVRLSDTGIGMREPMETAGARTLGLQLAAMLVAQLNGTIAMDSGGAGTVYTLTIPRNHLA